MLSDHEIPLKLQLGRSQKKPYIELRLLQVRDALVTPMMSSVSSKGGAGGGMTRADSEDSLDEDGGNNIVPKEEGEKREWRVREGGSGLPILYSIAHSSSLSPSPGVTVIDHGIASVEMLMEEALQDVPLLMQDIQERLRRTYTHTPIHSYAHSHIHLHTHIHPNIHDTSASPP